MTPTMTLLRGPEVCRLTGASYRMLDYWARTGAVVPEVEARGSGTQRRYTVDQAIAVRACFILSHLHAGTDVMRGLSSAMTARPDLVGQRVIVDDEGAVFDVSEPGIDGWVIDLAACADWVNGYMALGEHR